MVFDITQIKRIRNQLNMTQKEFALSIGISQSMIAKIEANKLDPTYSKVKMIENAIEKLTSKDKIEAKDIMTTSILSVNPGDNVHKIIGLMQKNSISQVPVIEKNSVIGIVSESSILSQKIEELKKLSAKDLMEENPPMIAKDTKLSIIQHLLQHYSLVLVKEKGKLIGLITRADLVKGLTL